MAAPELLAGLPLPDGFDPLAVLAASERIRDYCGWHIAPSVTQTVTVPVRWDDRRHQGVLILPSLYVTAVASVDGSADEFTWTSDGLVLLSTGRHCGLIEVTFTHGYGSCPLSLMSAVLQVAKQGLTPEPALKSKNIGPFQYGYFEPVDPLAGAWPYRIPVVA